VNATYEIISTKYKESAVIFHPDKQRAKTAVQQEANAERLQQVIDAAAWLRNEDRREAVDNHFNIDYFKRRKFAIIQENNQEIRNDLMKLQATMPAASRTQTPVSELIAVFSTGVAGATREGQASSSSSRNPGIGVTTTVGENKNLTKQSPPPPPNAPTAEQKASGGKEYLAAKQRERDAARFEVRTIPKFQAAAVPIDRKQNIEVWTSKFFLAHLSLLREIDETDDACTLQNSPHESLEDTIANYTSAIKDATIGKDVIGLAEPGFRRLGTDSGNINPFVNRFVYHIRIH
jgi:hypothetical protein